MIADVVMALRRSGALTGIRGINPVNRRPRLRFSRLELAKFCEEYATLGEAGWRLGIGKRVLRARLAAMGLAPVAHFAGAAMGFFAVDELDRAAAEAERVRNTPS